MEKPEYPPEYGDAAYMSSTRPLYHCSVQACSHVLLKHEFDTPGLKSRTRRWQQATASLRGTLLTLLCDGTTMHLSAQVGEVGIAADYSRRSHCLRVRVEGRQFLLAFASRESCLAWYQRLEEAISISLPLESRKEPPYRAGFRKRTYQAPPSLRGEITCGWRERRGSTSSKWLQCIYPSISVLEEGYYGEMSILPWDEDARDGDNISRDGGADTTAEHGKDELAAGAEKSDESTPRLSAKISPLDYAQRCARELLYGSQWKYSWYYRDGERRVIRGRDAVKPSRS